MVVYKGVLYAEFFVLFYKIEWRELGNPAVVRVKVIHPKYYKHLEKGAHQSQLGRQKMGWFLADWPVHQVKLKY